MNYKSFCYQSMLFATLVCTQFLTFSDVVAGSQLHSKSVNVYIFSKKVSMQYFSMCNPHHAFILFCADFGAMKTRKLSYHKDDRAMRTIYRCPENFRESVPKPTASFPEFFNRLLSMNARTQFELRSFDRS